MNKGIFCGVDEAGRGCVLGPLVLASCTINKDQESFYKDLGIKDSKLILKNKRNKLFEKITKTVLEYKIIVIPAEELNVLMNRYSLNEIEAQKTVAILKSLKINPDKFILDCPDTNTETYKKRIVHNLHIKGYKYNASNIISEHKADFNYISVSCASILAKVTRDKILKELTGTDISGYSSDPKTIEFIKNYILEHKEIPSYAREKWSTIKNIINELYQNKIGWFCEK